MPAVAPPLDPFADDIVSEPRRIEPAVPGLNEAPLAQLMGIFMALTGVPLPRLEARAGHVVLVSSPQAGYGKSHLLGRLYQALAGQAFCLSISPFEDPHSCWKSLLERTVRELKQARGLSGLPGGGSPLSALFHGVLLCLMAWWLEHRREGEGLSSRLEALRVRRAALDTLADDPAWMNLLHSLTPQDLDILADALGECCPGLQVSPRGWLGLILAYLLTGHGAGHGAGHEACLDWLLGEGGEEEWARRLGMGRRDLPPDFRGGGENEELCKNRLLDLCRLAGCSRPLVFCFDQTENYGRDPALVRALGVVIQTLADYAPNQLTVLTANNTPWTQCIEPYLEGAHRDRIRRPPLELQGLDRAQGVVLARQRLARAGAGQDETGQLLQDAWLAALFLDAPRMGVRSFLQACRHRWRVLCEQAPVPQPTLPEEFARHVAKVSAGALGYDRDLLRWLVNIVAPGLAGVQVAEENRPGGQSCVHWHHGGGECLFGFEAGAHWKRWSMLARQAEEYHRRVPGGKMVYFRTPEQRTIPGPSWQVAPEINAARERSLLLILLNEEQLRLLQAAHAVYSDAMQGDIDHGVEEVLEFLRDRLSDLWRDILTPAAVVQPPLEPPLPSDEPPLPPVSGGEVRINVSQLLHACLDARWRRAWLDGGETAPEDESPVKTGEERGRLFHAITEEFVGWLAGKEPKQSPADPREPQALWQALRERLASPSLRKLSTEGQVLADDYLVRALQAFCGGLARLRSVRPRCATWRELYLEREYPLENVPLELGGGRVLVSGRVDVLRRHPAYDAEVVEYKVARHGTRTQRDVLQVAIYARLLAAVKPGWKAGGVLEYYEPGLFALSLSPADLDRAFATMVEPVLAEIVAHCRAPLSSQPAASPDHAASTDHAEAIRQCFGRFGLEVAVTGKSEAPQLTRYRVQPAAGVKVVSLANRAEDLQVALSLAQPPLIDAAQGWVAVDIPRPEPLTVWWRDLIAADSAPADPLAFPLGVGVEGELIWGNLADATTCHALVAGASGSGKSEFLKALAASLVTRNSPRNLRLSLIDPKRLTFTSLEGLAHLAQPVIVDLARTFDFLDKTLQDMEERYRLLARDGFENLAQRLAAGRDDVSYHVIIFDEFADLILRGNAEKKAFEQRASRLAAKGRAAGLHLVLATQRPDRHVVTGIIKANLPLKVCFKVTTAANSQIVLDQPGAESLLGRGDLFCDRGRGVERAQSPLVTQQELMALTCRG